MPWLVWEIRKANQVPPNSHFPINTYWMHFKSYLVLYSHIFTTLHLHQPLTLNLPSPAMAEKLIASGRICGTLTGNRQVSQATYMPSIYTRTQNEWVDNFLKQNGYLGEFLQRILTHDLSNYYLILSIISSSFFFVNFFPSILQSLRKKLLLIIVIIILAPWDCSNNIKWYSSTVL